METWWLIFTVAGVYLLAAISPGPNFVVVINNALAHSRQTGLYTAAGVACGSTLHTLMGFVGISALVVQSVWLFQLVKVGGGVYLIVLGLQTLWSSRRAIELPAVDISQICAPGELTSGRALRTGFITCAVNPKAAVFFLSLFSLMIEPTTPLWAKVTMIIMIALLSFSWYSSVACLFSNDRARVIYLRSKRKINGLFGCLLIALGIKVSLT